MSVNVVVTPRRNEKPERMIKRFIKKCKKEKGVERYRARTDHYIKPSVKKKLKSEKARREQKKLQRKRDARLFR